MICWKCKSKISNDMIYCPKCGADLTSDTASTPVAGPGIKKKSTSVTGKSINQNVSTFPLWLKILIPCVVAAVIIIILIANGIIGGSGDREGSADTVIVPNVVNEHFEDAIRTADRSEMLLIITGKEYDNSIEINHVSSQDPQVRESAPKGSALFAVVSGGAEESVRQGEVPDIIYRTQNVATAMMEDAGIQYSIEYVESDNVLTGIVVAQPDSSQVVIEVSTGSDVQHRAIELASHGSFVNAEILDQIDANRSGFDNAAHAEAYEAYLGILFDQKNEIEMYDRQVFYPWKVAFADVDTLSAPIMILEALDDGAHMVSDNYDYYSFSNNLRIYSYDQGIKLELEKYIWPSEKIVSSCSVFTTFDGYLYVVQWEGAEGGCHLVIEQYRVGPTGLVKEDVWAFDFEGLSSHEAGYPLYVDIVDTYYWRDQGWGIVAKPAYSKNGQHISQKEFFDEIDEVISDIDIMTVNNIPEILIRAVDSDLERTFSLRDYGSNTMTHDDAIAMLGGNSLSGGYSRDGLNNITVAPVFPYVSASSVRERMGSNSYGPEKARDSDWATAWCEGQRGNGVGAWIELSADTLQTVSGIRLLNGYCKSPKTYYDNNTVAAVRIVTDAGETRWSLLDIPNEYQEYYFDTPISTRSVRIILEQVNEKGDRLDTLISELSVF